MKQVYSGKSLQAEALRQPPGVKSVHRDWKVRRLTHTPQFLGLPVSVWPTGGGSDRAGEDIVKGFVDSGINPRHPSFSNRNTALYEPLPTYRGKCEVDPHSKRGFCNGKIIGAQHFAAAGAFNADIDFASPLDGDGHGRAWAAYHYRHTVYEESCFEGQGIFLFQRNQNKPDQLFFKILGGCGLRGMLSTSLVKGVLAVTLPVGPNLLNVANKRERNEHVNFILASSSPLGLGEPLQVLPLPTELDILGVKEMGRKKYDEAPEEIVMRLEHDTHPHLRPLVEVAQLGLHRPRNITLSECIPSKVKKSGHSLL